MKQNKCKKITTKEELNGRSGMANIITRLKHLKKRELSNPYFDMDDYEEDAEIYGESVYNDTTDEVVFEEGKDAVNVDGINLMDIFYVVYNDINIFFMVSKTRSHAVALFELETINGKFIGEDNMPYETIDKDFKPRKRPYIIPENNCWTKTEFWVKSDKNGCLHIPILANAPLVRLDIARGRTPIMTEWVVEKLPKDKIIEEFKALCYAPFPVKRQADWIKPNEKLEKAAIA